MYLMSYAFHDDGTIAFRVGATGQNLPGQRHEAHVHSAHWRIDIDLVDGKKNSAMLMRHVEDPASLGAEDIKEPFNGGVEGGVDWDPKEFTMIRVESREEERPRRDDRLRPDAAALRHAAAQRRVHPPRPVGQPVASRAAARIPLRQPAQHRQGRGVGRADRHRALVQLGRRTTSRGTRTASPAPARGSGRATTPGKARPWSCGAASTCGRGTSSTGRRSIPTPRRRLRSRRAPDRARRSMADAPMRRPASNDRRAATLPISGGRLRPSMRGSGAMRRSPDEDQSTDRAGRVERAATSPGRRRAAAR